MKIDGSEFEKLEKQGIISVSIVSAKNGHCISKEDIIKFISKCIKKEPLQMIKLLVKEIILFDDKVEIYYNYIDKKVLMNLNIRIFCFIQKV